MEDISREVEDKKVIDNSKLVEGWRGKTKMVDDAVMTDNNGLVLKGLCQKKWGFFPSDNLFWLKLDVSIGTQSHAPSVIFKI